MEEKEMEEMTEDFMDSPEFQALIKEYVTYLHTSLPAVRNSLGEKLYRDVYKFGHNIKGTGTSYGFGDLTKIGTEICTDIKNENYGNLDTLLNGIEKILNDALE